MENYNKETEKKLIELIKQKEENDRRLLTFEWVIGILSFLVLFIPIIIASLVAMEDICRIIVMCSGVVPAIVGFGFTLRIEQVAGYYECKHCGHRYVPTYKAVNLSAHMGRTRYMRCPSCGKKSWQKKVISKED